MCVCIYIYIYIYIYILFLFFNEKLRKTVWKTKLPRGWFYVCGKINSFWIPISYTYSGTCLLEFPYCFPCSHSIRFQTLYTYIYICDWRLACMWYIISSCLKLFLNFFSISYFSTLKNFFKINLFFFSFCHLKNLCRHIFSPEAQTSFEKYNKISPLVNKDKESLLSSLQCTISWVI